jgi:2,5-diketo-D-gluconate reductase A
MMGRGATPVRSKNIKRTIMTNHRIPNVRMNDGRWIPQIGLGVSKIPVDDTTARVAQAINIGYRHIDTASLYGNEQGVGRGVISSGVPREDIFVTSKVWNDSHGFVATTAEFHESLGRLGLDYLDLYLIHWPIMQQEGFLDSWQALERLQAQGFVRSIGVSNFQIHHLASILRNAEVPPAVNQIELNPWVPMDELRAFHTDNGITTVAWAPLGKGELLQHPILGKMAEKHRRSPAQIVLRWHLQLGNVMIPKSNSPARLAENAAIFDFTLDCDDLAAIERMRRNYW